MYEHILPEISRRRREATYYNGKGGVVTAPAQKGLPEFPAACPACCAPLVSLNESSWGDCTYACGASYKDKPQIQNHTDIWWGYCPVTKAKHS